MGRRVAPIPPEPMYPAEVVDRDGRTWYRGWSKNAGWRMRGGGMRFSWTWEQLCEFLPTSTTPPEPTETNGGTRA